MPNIPAIGPVVTLGGVTVGLAILLWTLTRWAISGGKGGTQLGPIRIPDPKPLIPFAASLALGVLCINCTGGILGWIAWAMSWLSNHGGDAGLKYGMGSGTAITTRLGVHGLTPGGSAALALLLVVIVAAWKRVPKHTRRRMAAGIWSGATLGLAQGIAGIVGLVLVPVANWAGSWVAGLL